MAVIRYELTDQEKERLKHWHYHGNVEDTDRFKLINDKSKELAALIMECCPSGGNKSMSLSDLESVRMRANAAIAVDECIMRGGCR
jgi:hypothetical protein